MELAQATLNSLAFFLNENLLDVSDRESGANILLVHLRFGIKTALIIEEEVVRCFVETDGLRHHCTEILVELTKRGQLEMQTLQSLSHSLSSPRTNELATIILGSFVVGNSRATLPSFVIDALSNALHTKLNNVYFKNILITIETLVERGITLTPLSIKNLEQIALTQTVDLQLLNILSLTAQKGSYAPDSRLLEGFESLFETHVSGIFGIEAILKHSGLMKQASITRLIMVISDKDTAIYIKKYGINCLTYHYKRIGQAFPNELASVLESWDPSLHAEIFEALLVHVTNKGILHNLKAFLGHPRAIDLAIHQTNNLDFLGQALIFRGTKDEHRDKARDALKANQASLTADLASLVTQEESVGKELHVIEKILITRPNHYSWRFLADLERAVDSPIQPLIIALIFTLIHNSQDIPGNLIAAILPILPPHDRITLLLFAMENRLYDLNEISIELSNILVQNQLEDDDAVKVLRGLFTQGFLSNLIVDKLKQIFETSQNETLLLAAIQLDAKQQIDLKVYLAQNAAIRRAMITCYRHTQKRGQAVEHLIALLQYEEIREEAWYILSGIEDIHVQEFDSIGINIFQFRRGKFTSKNCST